MKEFDPKLNNKILGHKGGFNGEAFWKDLAPKLPKKKKKLPIAFWLFLLTCAIGATGIWMKSNNEIGNKDFITSSPKDATVYNEQIKASSAPTDESPVEPVTIESSKATSTLKSIKNVPDHPPLASSYPNWETGIDADNRSPEVLTTTPASDQDTPNNYKTTSPNALSVILQPAPLGRPQIQYAQHLEELYPNYVSLKVHKVKPTSTTTISLISGIYASNNSFNASMNEADWSTSRKRFEENMISIDYGALLQWVSHKNWGVSLGVIHSQFLDVLDYQNRSTSTTKSSFSQIISTPKGDTTIAGDDYITKSTERRIRNGNHRTYMNIPLSISYTYRLNQWAVEGRIGLTFHKLLSYSGKSINPQEDLVEWGEDPETTYSSNFRQSYHTSISLIRRLKGRWSVAITPQLDWTHQNMLQARSKVEHSYFRYGLNTSLRFDF